MVTARGINRVSALGFRQGVKATKAGRPQPRRFGRWLRCCHVPLTFEPHVPGDAQRRKPHLPLQLPPLDEFRFPVACGNPPISPKRAENNPMRIAARGMLNRLRTKSAFRRHAECGGVRYTWRSEADWTRI